MEGGGRVDPFGSAPWCPPNQTGWTQVRTHGSVDKRHVPGDARHSCLRLFHPLHVPDQEEAGVLMSSVCVNVLLMGIRARWLEGGGAMSSWLQARDQQGWCCHHGQGTTIPWKGFFLSYLNTCLHIVITCFCVCLMKEIPCAG
jgi:hypothetical protein